MRMLIAGSAMFGGRSFVRHMLTEHLETELIVLDKLSDARCTKVSIA